MVPARLEPLPRCDPDLVPNRRDIPADPPEPWLGEPPAPLRKRPLEWNFGPDIIRMPEFCAPALGNRGTPVTMDAELPEKASGVLYALGGSGGGLTC